MSVSFSSLLYEALAPRVTQNTNIKRSSYTVDESSCGATVSCGASVLGAGVGVTGRAAAN
eukprot:8714-Heterococcus_DN1.PRE.1